MRRTLILFVLLSSACADDPVVDAPRGTTTATGLGADDLIASCDGVRFAELPPDTSTLTPFDGWDDLDLTRLGGEEPYFLEFVAGYDWFVTEEDASSRTLFGQPRGSEERDPPYASASLEVRDERWAPVGWGQCRIELEAEGWGNARFTIDPASRPAPEVDRISLLATEVACAGGRAPRGRDVRGVILEETGAAVSIVILVEPSEGAVTCQGNPGFPFEVGLGTSLGDRQILDASVYPAEVVWPEGTSANEG